MNAGRQQDPGTDTRSRYRRVAPVYDLLDLPFEYARYRRLRRILCAGLSGRILDAGVGTGRNIPFYPPEAVVTAIDLSPEMLARAQRREAGSGVTVELLERDVRDTGFPDATFDAVIASFLFCVLPDEDQLPALRELARVCKPNGEVRLLEYIRPRRGFRRFLTRLWEPWVRWAYGASFDRVIERHMASAGLVLIEARFVVDELIRYLVARPRGDEGPGAGEAREVANERQSHRRQRKFIAGGLSGGVYSSSEFRPCEHEPP